MKKYTHIGLLLGLLALVSGCANGGYVAHDGTATGGQTTIDTKIDATLDTKPK
jgi:hypothetical protein